MNIGTTPSVLIAGNISTPTELVLGGTNDPKLSEVNFKGYFKEFRFWNATRSAFDILNARNYDVTSQASILFAYWKLDEVNDGTVTVYTDRSLNGSTFNPTSIVASQTV